MKYFSLFNAIKIQGVIIGFLCFGLLCIPYKLVGQKVESSYYAEDYQVITRDGAWCWFSDPRAIYVDGRMFGGFVDKQGSIWAFS